jgi:hypothetical protein
MRRAELLQGMCERSFRRYLVRYEAEGLEAVGTSGKLVAGEAQNQLHESGNAYFRYLITLSSQLPKSRRDRRESPFRDWRDGMDVR